MENPFLNARPTFSEKVRKVVDPLKIGESAPFHMDGELRGKLAGTLANYSVIGKFATMKDRTDDNIVWIKRLK